MEFSKKQLNKFKEVWLDYSGEVLSDTEASELFEQVVKLLIPVYYDKL